MAYPLMPCTGCGASIADRPDRKTTMCRACTLAIRCQACGLMLASPHAEHRCLSVDLKPERRCCDCESPLSYQGYERWKQRCPHCEKIRWRRKERQQRRDMLQRFGGCCARCGYARCTAALHFHHKVSHEKYAWTKKGGTSIRELVAHPERFELLCANCHVEHHEHERQKGRVA
jgi:hypothetical protein